MRRHIRARARWGVWLLSLGLGVPGLLYLVDRALPPPIHAVAVGTLVLDRHGAPLRAFPVDGGTWRLPVEMDQVDPAFIEALIAYEDQRYATHFGVDPLAVARAAWQSARAGRVVSGASTLTMQTARLLEPRPRTVFGKLHQVLRAVQLEIRLDKQEILELYLTLAPYGGNLEGIRAASWAWFGHEPDQLTREEIALLIALPQSPESRRPDLHPEAARSARASVLERLAARGLVPAPAAAESLRDPVPHRRSFPAHAWHASADVARRVAQSRVQADVAGDAAADVPGDARGDVRTTLDAGLQRRLEVLAEEALRTLQEDVQIALIVVENESRAVRALLGSAARERPGGWIDLTTRPRSPGSTLKPFVYGMAFDDGLLDAQTRIADLPRRFHDYRPENFDRSFNGEVTVAEALQHSLNVPAVLALDRVGGHRFRVQLDQAGVAPRIPGPLGEGSSLALALGGAGMTVREVAALYAALGSDGHVRPLRWRETTATDSEDGARMLSAESAAEILDILRRAPHPGGRAPSALVDGAIDIAFKTGTSYGFRDAWAAGVAGGHTVVVWIGRADGRPRPGVTGRAAALPALFDAFDVLGDANVLVATVGESAAMDAVLPEGAFGTDHAPHILFPPDGSEVFSDGSERGFVLAAQGTGPLRWYANGEPLVGDPLRNALWLPSGPGFHELEVRDRLGRSGRARVRIVASGD